MLGWRLKSYVSEQGGNVWKLIQRSVSKSSNSIKVSFLNFRVDELRNHIAKQATGAFGIKLFTIGFSLISNVLLARWMGVFEYGIFTYVVAWISLLQVPAMLGLNQLLARNISKFLSEEDWGMMSGLLRWANRNALVASSIIAIIAAGIGSLILEDSSEILPAFLLGVLCLPFVVLTGLRQAAMRGLHRVVVGQIPEAVVKPMVLVVITGLLTLLLHKVSAVVTMIANIAAVSCAFLLGTYLLFKNLPISIKSAKPLYNKREWTHSILPLTFIASLFIINSKVSLIILGAIKGPESVAFYNVIDKGVSFIAFLAIAVKAPLGPVVVKLYNEGNLKRLQSIVTASVRVVSLISFIITGSLIIFGRWFLLLFGPQFVQAQTALVILSVGQLINVSMGPLGMLLIMTGHESVTAKALGISALIMVALNFILIPDWGIEGAALATSIGTTIWNLVLMRNVINRLGIQPTAIGQIKA